MRILMTLLLTFSLLTGCGAVPMEEQAPQSGETAGTDTPQEEEATMAVSFATEMRTIQWEHPAEDGQVLARAQFEVPELVVYRSDGSRIEEGTLPLEWEALEKAEAFNDGIMEWVVEENFQEVSQMAEEERAWRDENGMPFEPLSLELTCEVYETGKLISVSGLYYSYTGGVHPNTCHLAKNFDLTTGQFFAPALLAKDGREFIEAVQQEIIRQAQAPSELGTPMLDGYFEDYENIIRDWGNYAVSFDENGMTVTFSAYVLACYAAGPQTFTMPYEFLTPYFSGHAMDLLGLETI